MLINKHLCVCLMTLIAAFVPASTLAGDNAVKFYLDNISVTGMPADVAAAIEDKLLAALTRTEAVDMSQHNVFHIIPTIDFTEAAETEGMIREVARVQADLKLAACNPVDGTVYHMVTIPLKGSAAGGKDAAMRKLANSLKPTDPVFVRFVRTSRQRIQDHYAENFGNIIAQAQRLKGMGRYAEAASYLSAVPPSVACFDQSEALLGEIMPYLSQKPDTVVVVEQVEVPVETIVEVPTKPDTVVVEKVVEKVVEVPADTPKRKNPVGGGHGIVTIEGQDLEFEILSCVGDMTRHAINISARVTNTLSDNPKPYVSLVNAFTPSGTELTKLSLDGQTGRSRNISMPYGVPVTVKFSITDVRDRIDMLTYLELSIRGIRVSVRELPVRWR